MRTKYFIFIVLVVFALFRIENVVAGEKWSVKGTFVEGCSCNAPCPCELTGLEKGCYGVGAILLNGGSFMKTDLGGAKIAYALVPGSWVRIYVDAENDKQKDAATEFAKGIFSSFGKIESTSVVKIEFSGEHGNYTLKVDGGKILHLTTEPVLGGDNKTPVTHANTKNKLNPVFMQGRTVSGSLSDGERKFELKGGNSYFNDHMESKGIFE
ncbi:MAG TPA: DUF1326 domain-containing protein [Candidatus Brocadiaceae bacterium]